MNNYYPSNGYYSGQVQSTRSVLLEFVVFIPRNEWLMGEMFRTALVVSQRCRSYQSVQVFQDPGPGYQNIADNHIRPQTRSRVESLGDIIYQLPIPLSPSSDFRRVVDLMQSMEKVDTRINPGGLFPWTFGNFVKRAVQKLARDGHIVDGSFHPTLPAADYLYDSFISRYLGAGHM